MRSVSLLLISFLLAPGCIIQTAAQPSSPGGTYVANPGPPSADGGFTINGVAPTPEQRASLAQVEAAYGVTLPPGNYWYDPVCGAFGRWGGPTEAIITAGLDLGPGLPENASGGGSGVYINGRELPPAEKAYIEYLVEAPLPSGRYYIDAAGNAGLEGLGATINLLDAARAHSGQDGDGGDGSGEVSISGGVDATGRASWFESDGRCKYIETPSGGFSSGC